MTKTASQSVLRWLRDNGIKLGALTSTDTRALYAAVHIADLWLNSDDRQATAEAFGRVVLQMQEHTRFMAFHAIAHVGDWCHRAQLWAQAGLPPLGSIPACRCGPRSPAAVVFDSGERVPVEENS